MRAAAPITVPSPAVLRADDLLPNTSFEAARERLRPLVADIRRLRRLRLVPSCMIAFENRETVLWQVQEVLRVEQRSTPRQVARELSRYQCLLAQPGELRATVFVDGGTPREADLLCERLGSDPRALELRVGGRSCFGECVDEQPGIASPVRYFSFDVQGRGIEPLDIATRPAELIVQGSSAPQLLPRDLRRALATDLRVGQRADLRGTSLFVD